MVTMTSSDYHDTQAYRTLIEHFYTPSSKTFLKMIKLQRNSSKISSTITMFSLRWSHILKLRAPLRAARHPIRRTPIQAFHTSRRLQLPYKDDQDRESLKPKSTEGTKSSTDEAAAHTDTAFDPSTTRPEDEKTAAKKETKQDETSPLDASGADQEASRPLGDKGGSEMQETTKSERNKASRGGSPQKKGRSPAI